jgi:hypothetical protein
MVVHWIYWHHEIEDHVPKRAILGGKHDTSDPIYIARVKHLDHILPAKYIPNLKVCYTSFNGKEIPVQEFELLTGDSHKFTWEPASFGVRKNVIYLKIKYIKELYFSERTSKHSFDWHF